MRLTHAALTVSTLLFAASAVFAAPQANAPDEIDKLLAEKGLLTQLSDHIGQVRQSVGEKASELVVNAMGFLGVPYRRGGNSVETGFDCSGFVRAMYQQTVG